MNERMVATVLTAVIAPAAVICACIGASRLWTWAARSVSERAERRLVPEVASAPIEKLAGTLRRLLDEHRRLTVSSQPGVRMHHLKALEYAIAYCALDAAIALDVPRPAGWERGTLLTTAEIGSLLRSLAAAGLAMPSGDDLLLAGLDGRPGSVAGKPRRP